MKHFAILIFFLLTVALGVSVQDFKNELWLEDFEQLKAEMSAHYANLEWAVAERGVDLQQLSAETDTRCQFTEKLKEILRTKKAERIYAVGFTGN